MGASSVTTEQGVVEGGAAAGDRAAHPAQPDAPSLDLPFRPKSSDPLVEGDGLEVIRRTERTPDQGLGTGGGSLVFEDGEWWIEWEREFYPPGSREAAVYGPDPAWCASVVSSARRSWCSSSRRYLASVTTGRAFALPCHAWNCPGCNKRKWFACRELFRIGIESAWARDERVRFLTLTDQHGQMSVEELSAAWDDLAQLLRRGGPAPKRPNKPEKMETLADKKEWEKRYASWVKKCKARKPLLREYAAAVEFGAGHDRIHLHVLMTGQYVKQEKLSYWARRCGFGEISFIREVEQGTAAEIGGYAGKMASYAAKASKHVELMKDRGALRARPVRASKGWVPGGLRGIEEQLGIRPKKRTGSEPLRDGGPWAIIELNSGGVPEWVRTIGATDSLPHVG